MRGKKFVSGDEPASPSNRRQFLRTVAGSATTVGALGAAAIPAEAHHAEDPDHTYQEKYESCSDLYGYETHGALNVDTYYRGYDDDRHKYEWVTAVGASAGAVDGNGDPYNDINKANLQIKWDNNQYNYRALEPEPAGYDPTVYAYADTSNPDDGEDIAEQAAESAAEYLVGLVPYGDLVWTGSELLYNMLVEDETVDWYGGEYDAWFEYRDWNYGKYVQQGHYDWIYHVYLDGYDYLSVEITDTLYGYYNDIGATIEVDYWTDEFGEHVDHELVGKTQYC